MWRLSFPSGPSIEELRSCGVGRHTIVSVPGQLLLLASPHDLKSLAGGCVGLQKIAHFRQV